MSRDRQEEAVIDAKQLEPVPQIGRIVSKENGVYSIIVNGRAEPRAAVAEGDLRDGDYTEFDEVLVLASDKQDMSVIVARSPWLVNQGGTAYDA